MLIKQIFIWFVVIMVFPSRPARAQDNFVEYRFKGAVQKALKDVETILGTTKHPVIAGDADHLYEDKYLLAEFLTDTTVASYVNVLKRMGLSGENLSTALNWAQDEKQAVTVTFSSETKCQFEKKEERKVVTHEHEVETTKKTFGSMLGGGRSGQTQTDTVKVKSTLTDYHWNVNVSYKITMKKGVDDESTIVLQSNEIPPVKIRSTVGGKQVDDNPRPPVAERKRSHSLSLTWLLQILSKDLICDFSIDRSDKECKTPARNKDIDGSIEFKKELLVWARAAVSALRDIDRQLSSLKGQEGNSINGLLGHITTENIFNPILPLFENSTVLSSTDSNTLLSQQEATLDSESNKIAKLVEEKATAFTTSEGILFLHFNHLFALAERYSHSITYVESMLENQLFQAIGKRIEASDFDEFMAFHNQKFFGDDYAPKTFTYAVRRPKHYPDGVISIEGQSEKQPIETLVRAISSEEATPLYMPVSAATNIELQGDRYLHGWVQHVWSDNARGKSHNLVARAHQFSSFLLVIGVMGGPDSFLPKQAIILQNKDEVLIPLLTNVLPSAKEFKDAISSLSPEQQEFAKAFRAMQLESSVFGVCVIQLKPQLEKLLNLPEGALTKEIQLTQDLMSLFVDYQIPSDLLSYDPEYSQQGEDGSASVSDKVDAVKGYVKAVMDTIEGEKAKQLKAEEDKKKMRYNMESSDDRVPFGAQDDTYDWGAHPDYIEEGADLCASYAAPTARPSAAPRRVRITGQRKLAKAPKTRGGGGEEIALSMMAPPPVEESGALHRMAAAAEGPETDYYEGGPVLNDENIQSSSRQFEDLPPVRGQPKSGNMNDFTLIPKLLDAKLEQLDKEGALRSTTVKADDKNWLRSRQENLLRPLDRKDLSLDDISAEKNKAFDLLTAISRSGSLPIAASELHVIIAVSHCFEKDILGTIIQDNVNPIEKVEKSMLMIGSVIHNEYPTKLLAAGQENKEGLLTEE